MQVVEDEAITAMDIQNRLQGMGYVVPAIVSTGEDAIRVTKEVKPNVIVMDIYLKGEVDGIQAAYEISRFSNIPVIFITSHTDVACFNRAKEAGPYAFIAKPCESREMNNAIEIALYKHNAELKIIAVKRRYQAIMQNASCAMFIHDENGIIQEVNLAAELIFGCDSAHLINQDFRKFVVDSEQSYASAMLKKIVREKHIGPNLGHIHQPCGKIVDVEFSSVYIENKNDNFILGVFTDTTERNRLRAQALLSDKLSTIGALSAGLVHEINNPLTWVLSNLSFLKDKMNDVQISSPAQKELMIDLINETIQGADRINKLVHNLKGFARVDKEEIIYVDIRKSLEAAISIAQPQCKNRSKIELTYADDIPELLMTDSRLQQVFLNLIVNAAQSMDEENIKNNRIKIIAQIKDNSIYISFSDTGKGIPAEILDKIFEPFYTTKPVGVGTGLGLSICSDIIHNAGGQITVESALEVGSIFTVCLPLRFQLGSVDETLPAIHEIITPKRLLVVDDEHPLLLAIQRMLGQQHYITICNGRKALELLTNNPENFDGIIADLNMSDINGIDLYRYLASHNSLLAKKMIFTNAEPVSIVKTEFIESIDNPCLDKPFTVKQLKAAINNVFSE